jgi:hypothetical protein
MISNYDPTIETKWSRVLEGIDDDYNRKVCAVLLENQAKAIVSDRVDELVGTDAPTTVGKLGTFQKFAFPLVRRVYPQLLANNLVGVQPMQGPVSQIFYLGHDRDYGGGTRTQTVFSRYNLTYANLTNSAIDTGVGNTAAQALALATSGRVGFADFSAADIALSSLGLDNDYGSCADSWLSPAAPSATMGGKIASFPIAETIIGYSVSAGEALTSTGIAELNLHIDQQPVVARTRKMRALWTLEAAQDLRAYHNLDLEGELTSLLSKELALEIDREIVEDLRMIAYDPNGVTGWKAGTLTGMQNTNNFGDSQQGVGPGANMPADANWAAQAAGSYGTQTFQPSAFLYDFANAAANTGIGPDAGQNSNVWLVDLANTDDQFGAAPQHVGQVYSNLLAIINFASQDIYRTTFRGPGNWLITSPLIASMLESAAKLEGGVMPQDGPTNFSRTAIQYKGKFMGRYDLWVDPMYPEDEIMVGYKGDNAMDSGYVYAPYIPLQAMPTITDPQDFQPRKGILTRYGKAAVGPYYRFYRIIRVVGAGANYLFNPFGKGGGSDALNKA